MSEIIQESRIEFGEVPPAVDEILQQGVSLYRQNRTAADHCFRDALAVDPTVLPTYLCLYKTYTYQGRLDDAFLIAQAGLVEATRQSDWPSNWQEWTPELVRSGVTEPARFALYTLKALSFIQLKRSEAEDSRNMLAKLEELGQLEAVGGSVVTDLVDAVHTDGT